MYISPAAVRASYKRLKASLQAGKSFQEKTSCLMYFLSFDVLSKKKNSTIIDFPPKSITRRELAVEYSRLVLLQNRQGVRQQIAELGVVETSGKDPEKRISSNFFTVPLKKASETAEISQYPSRPVPLLQLGPITTGIQWGIALHPNWGNNFSEFLKDVTGNSPFTDLAIVVCRNDEIEDCDAEWRNAISATIRKKFTDDVASFWVDKIESEKVFVKHLQNDSFFSDGIQPVDLVSGASRKTELRGMRKDDLISHILYLEKILDTNSILYFKSTSKEGEI